MRDVSRFELPTFWEFGLCSSILLKTHRLCCCLGLIGRLLVCPVRESVSVKAFRIWSLKILIEFCRWLILCRVRAAWTLVIVELILSVLTLNYKSTLPVTQGHTRSNWAEFSRAHVYIFSLPRDAEAVVVLFLQFVLLLDFRFDLTYCILKMNDFLFNMTWQF